MLFKNKDVIVWSAPVNVSVILLTYISEDSVTLDNLVNNDDAV